jgi:adenylate cyclase
VTKPVNQDKQQAVLFADVSESTRLYDTVGDKIAFAAVAACTQIMRARTETHGGRVVKTIGDEVMALFPGASAAAEAAIAMHLGVNALPPLAGSKLAVRVGMHYGHVVESGGDIFGDTVNLASRLVESANRGQIITSRETVDAMDERLRTACRPLYAITIKGKAKEVELCELLWRPGDDETMIIPSLSGVPPPAVLRLRHRDQIIILDASRDALTVGRDKTSELVVAELSASRAHGRIEHRQGKFVFVDQSANGTYIMVEGDSELVLRREEFVLRGRGSITLGQSRKTASEPIEFSCE